jgi:hypothetical protein
MVSKALIKTYGPPCVIFYSDSPKKLGILSIYHILKLQFKFFSNTACPPKVFDLGL